MKNTAKSSHLLLTSILIVCSVTFCSCGLLDSDKDEPLQILKSPETQLIPLAVGNYWVYDQWQVEPTWRDTVRNEVLSLREVIIENTMVRAYGTYRFRYDDEPREDALISLSANGLDGHFVLGFDAPFDSLNILANKLRFKYPANPGDSWEYTAILFNVVEQKLLIGETRTVSLVDTTKTVETQAGTFENCYVYTFFDFRTASLIRHYMFIKSTVGLVGVDSYAGEDLYGQQRLLEYHLENNSP